MSDLFLPSKCRMAWISPHFPLPHGVPRVDDRRVVGDIVYLIGNGLQWKDAHRGIRAVSRLPGGRPELSRAGGVIR